MAPVAEPVSTLSVRLADVSSVKVSVALMPDSRVAVQLASDGDTVNRSLMFPGPLRVPPPKPWTATRCSRLVNVAVSLAVV